MCMTLPHPVLCCTRYLMIGDTTLEQEGCCHANRVANNKLDGSAGVRIIIRQNADMSTANEHWIGKVPVIGQRLAQTHLAAAGAQLLQVTITATPPPASHKL